MKPYQSLIDDVVTLVNATRGFIILYDPSTNTLQYVAANNFIPADNRYPHQMFLDLFADPEPRLTNNSIRLKYLPPGVISTLEPYHVILVPLKKSSAVYGLLWCDRHVKQGLFSQDDLAGVVSLVAYFHITP